MSAPDADERRIRRELLNKIDGEPTAPAASGGDWWDRLYDDTPDHSGPAPRKPRIPIPHRPPPPKAGPTEQPGPDPDDADPQWEDAEPGDESTPQAVRRARRSPAREWRAGWSQTDRRTRWLLINGAAAGAGWLLELAPLFRGWITDCGHQSGATAALCLGAGLVFGAALLDGRARGWWPPLAWACRIPLASAVLAVCLYAPGVPQ